MIPCFGRSDMENFHENKKRSTSFIECNECGQFSVYGGECQVCVDNQVDSPKHYTGDGVECIKYIEQVLSPEQFIGFLRGNAIKYQHRMMYKGKPIQDCQKFNKYGEWQEQAMRGEKIKV
jgi:hypothetical protein